MTDSSRIHPRVVAFGSVLLLAAAVAPAMAQQMDHSMHKPARQAEPAPKAKPALRRKATPAAPRQDEVDHAAMGHGAPAAPEALVDPPAMELSGRDHSEGGHDVPAMSEPGMDHSRMDQGDMSMPTTVPREPIPVITEADRRAAFPDVAGHAVHDDGIHSYWLMDRLEGWDADEGTGLEWEGVAWIGTDMNRLWLRSEGERMGGSTGSADLEMLYGRSIARWWDLLVGVRHDFKPGASQSFAAIGVIGLAPQKFEVQATAYLGERGQTAARVEVEYDLLLTNRLILQPLAEANLYGSNDEARGVGSGLGTIEAGLRLRYEFTRKFAPYIGIVRERAFGTTADYRRQDGEDVDDTRFVAGVRFWF